MKYEFATIILNGHQSYIELHFILDSIDFCTTLPSISFLAFPRKSFCHSSLDLLGMISFKIMTVDKCYTLS